MRYRILAAFLGLTALLLLASAALAQATASQGAERSQEAASLEPQASLEEAASGAWSAPPPSGRLAQQYVAAPPPPPIQQRQTVEQPLSLMNSDDQVPTEPVLPVPQGSSLAGEAFPPDLVFPWRRAPLPAMEPYLAPRTSPAGMGILEATKAITVVDTYDFIWGYHSSTDATLLLRLYHGATLKGFGVARTDGLGYFQGRFFDQGSQVGINPGDTVKVGTGVTTDTIEVVQTTGSADPVNDTVTGVITGTGLSLPVSVTVSFPWAGIKDTVSTNETGDFTRDFSAVYDMSATDPAAVSYEDAQGNHVVAWLAPVGFFCVCQTYDEVDGFAAPGATVTITRNPELGSPESDSTTASGQDGSYRVGFSVVESGDVVEVDDGTSVISTTVVTLTAMAAPWASDVISGTAPADSNMGVGVSQVSTAGYWQWHEKTVTSNSSGGFSADFSGTLDLDRLSSIWVIFPDASGNETAVNYSPSLAAVSETYDNMWGFVTPGSEVTATLKESVGTVKDIQSSKGDTASGSYRIEFGTDVQTGDIVEVTGGGISTTVVVTSLTALADTAADTISGVSPSNSQLIVSSWREGNMPAPGFDELVDSTGAGTYTDDLSGRYDLYNGYQGDVYYSQPDEHKLSVRFHAPAVNVDQTYDGAYGYVDTANTQVTVTLRTGTGTVEDQVVITSHEHDGHFQAWYDGSVSIDPGDTVEVETTSWTNVVTITQFSLDFDIDTDTVWGTGPANTMMSIFVLDSRWNYLGGTAVPTDDSGNFTADFSDIVDMHGGEAIGLGCDNDDHNFNYSYGLVPYLRVNQTQNWIQGVAVPGATVNITVTGGSGTSTASTTAGEDGGFWVGTWDFSPAPLDIQAGDLVEMSSAGVYRSVDVVAMSGDPDIDADAISGHIDGASANEPVVVEIWEEGGGSAAVTTDADGDYSADLLPWDLKAGHELAVWYITPDGDECGIVVNYLRINANITSGYVDGQTMPDATLNVTVTGSGIKGTAEAASDKDGFYGTEVYTDGTKAYIDIGDTVYASADGREASVFVGGPLSAQADADTDTVFGDAPPDTDLFVEFWDDGRFETKSDEFGGYSFDAGAEGMDLQAGMGGLVGYRTDEGHQVAVDFWLPFMRVNQTHDWVGARVAASSTVYVTVTRGLYTFLASTTSQPDGWFQVEGHDFTPQVDIQVDDLVEVGCDGRHRSLTVVTMTGELDTTDNTISGSIVGASNAPIRVEMLEEGGGAIEGTTDEYGGYSVDLSSWELKAGDSVAVWYITPDGDELAAVFQAPFARVNYTWDGVDGRVAPFATVYVTVTNGGVKGTNSGDAGSDGWFSFGAGADVVPGDTVYATSSAGLDATMEIITITGAVDVDTDIVSGNMIGGDFPAEGYVEVGRPPGWDPSDSRPIDIDGDGNYSADFSEFDIQAGDEAHVWYRQADGNEVGIALFTLPLRQLRVFQTHDWVQVQGQSGNTVLLTVTNGLVKGTGMAVIGDNGWAQTEVYSGTDKVDIQVGDIVQASSEGYLRSADVITITGLVDPEENTVAGQIQGAAGYPADLNVEVWVPGVDLGKEDSTDGSGGYEVDLDPDYDVQMGDEICVWYHEPDGDQVGSLFSALRLGVSSSNDGYWGQSGPPGTTITLTVKDSGGATKGQAFPTADKDGWFEGGFSSVDVEPGDTLEAETSLLADSVYVLPLPAAFDVDADLLSGTCVPDGYMFVNVARDEESIYLESIPTDGDGDFTIDLGAAGWDLQIGDYVDLNCRIPAGHWVHRSFEVQVYYVYVPLVMKNLTGLSMAGLTELPVETPTPTSTPTPSPTPTLVPTPTITPTLVPTATPTATAVITVTPTVTVTPTLEATATPVPSVAPASTVPATSTPTEAVTPTSEAKGGPKGH